MNAWVFQDSKQLAKLGDKCPWSVGWYDPDGKRKGKKIGAKSRAQKYARKIEGQLAAGVYSQASPKVWKEFRLEYEQRGMVGNTQGSKDIAGVALDHFERLIKPARVNAITSRTVSEFVALRQAETIGKGESERPVSYATINKELRYIRAVARKAHRWNYLSRVPEIDFLKEPGKLPTYITPEHFTELYKSCNVARWPATMPFSATDWWRALLVTGYMTGWRIGSLMALKREDVDLTAALAISRAADNKGKRDQRIPLHPVVVEHLERIASFSPLVFTWSHGRRALFSEFDAIQKAAGVRPEGTKARYGFHDLRRAFATLNAATLTPDALQALMQHKDYTTTQRYINLARQMNPAVQNLFVPKLPIVVAAS